MNAFFFRQFSVELNSLAGRCDMRISSIGLIAAVSLGLGGCATNGLGVGVGSGYGYDGYGYDRYGYGYDRYGYGYGYPAGYSPYGYNPYGGWSNGYYYPGTGGWVYDRDGRRREANFGGLGEAFRQAVKDRNATTTTSGTTAVTTTTRVRAPSRTRVIERTERTERPTTTERSRSGAAKILRGVRKDD